MREKTSGTLLMLLLIGMSTLACKIEVALAVNYPAIYVDPPSIIDPTLTPGKNFTVSIKTDYNGSDIFGWQFTLSFNPNVLQGINVSNGDLITKDVDLFAMFIPGTFNNTAGTLSLTGAYFFFLLPPVSLTSGPGTLANVTFTVVGYGRSNITIGPETDLIGFTDNGFEDSYDIIDAATMPNNIGHGYFENAGDVAVTDVMQWFRAIPVTDAAYST